MVFDPVTILFGLALLAGLIALSWTDIKSYRLRVSLGSLPAISFF